MKIIVAAGARPNFVKAAPLLDALNAARASRPGLEFMLVHTGQHYDEEMSQAFFADLGLPRPDVDLGVGSGTHAEQTGNVMIAFEALLIKARPDWVVVVGDANSTVSCALAASKLGIKVAHVEAGLRSRDRTMPEEINRVVTDVLSEALFTTEPAASENLRAEGVDPARIHFVGNVLIDTLFKHRARAEAMRYWERLSLHPGSYAVLTLHRPGNVDQREILERIASAMEQIQQSLPLVFPVHPRTRKMAETFGLWKRIQSWPNARVVGPLGYLEMLSLTSHAALILTDSGGLQEEAAALGVPCLTLRDNTERPITIEVGANQVVGNRLQAIIAAVDALLKQGWPQIRLPEKWDGRAAERIVGIMLDGRGCAVGSDGPVKNPGVT
jgi:UDP-N-acetylglucosamine 2-epimerase (non-hydrolysing)